MIERTLGILKPDLVEAGRTDEAIADLKAAGLVPLWHEAPLSPEDSVENHMRAWRWRRKLYPTQAQALYRVHEGKSFFRGLVDFMTSGPVVLMVLEGEDAIARYRGLLGATDPAAAAEGTLRKKYGTDVPRNAFHASDSKESAYRELAWCLSVVAPWYFGTLAFKGALVLKSGSR